MEKYLGTSSSSCLPAPSFPSTRIKTITFVMPITCPLLVILPTWPGKHSHYFLIRTLRLKEVKKVAPSCTIAEQGTSSYPRSVWFQDLHFIFCQITKLFIQRRLAGSQGQQCGSPTRKSPSLGPFLVQDLIIGLERISLSLPYLVSSLGAERTHVLNFSITRAYHAVGAQ